ncbi:WG repeat-containing protein [Flavobacteriaceae bacterium XHP0103]|uniref:WG repeat-containing protein n=1 Tax=Marixanthotalea marina TaxID=2844359 RepID=UPI002989F738|nr:WG repeat-containing protein [Marixanthotalea marina]MBU3821610.1 WG repeat-containing protein [Marixanthotalea marina]
MEHLDFGKKLIEVRKQKGLTQSEVAEKCNVTIRTIQRIESGAVAPRSSTIKIISESLDFEFFETPNQHSTLKSHTLLWYVKDLFNFKTNAMKKISILSVCLLLVIFTFSSLFTSKAQSATPQNNTKDITKNELQTTVENDSTPYDFSKVYDKYEIREYFVIVVKNNKFGITKRNGKVIIPCEYHRLNVEGNYVLTLKNNRRGLMTMDGKTIIPCEFDEFEVEGNLVATRRNNKLGLMNLDGKTIVPCEYDDFEIENNFVFTLKNNKRGLMNLDGKTIIPCEFDEFEIESGFVFVLKNSKKGLMNLDGETIIPCEYHKFQVENNFVLVSKYNKHGLMNLEGETIIPCEYDTLKIEGYLAIVTKNGKTEQIRI